MGRRVVAGEAFDVRDRDAADRGDAFRRVLGRARPELIEAAGPAGDVILVEEPVADDDVHHAKRERRVGAGVDGDVPVRGARGARGVRVDDDELRAVAARFFNEGPEVDVVAVNVGRPGEDQLRVRESFGVGAELAAVDGDQGLATCLRADGAVELRGAETVEEAAIHGTVAELADGAGVGIRQDRFGAVLAGDGGEAGRDGVEGFVPGNALERLGFTAVWQRGFGHAGAAAHRVEQAVRRVNTVEVLRHFAAEEAARDGVIGVAAEFGGTSCFVDGDEHPAGVGAVMRADSMNSAGHGYRVQRTGCRVQAAAASGDQWAGSRNDQRVSFAGASSGVWVGMG